MRVYNLLIGFFAIFIFSGLSYASDIQVDSSPSNKKCESRDEMTIAYLNGVNGNNKLQNIYQILKIEELVETRSSSFSREDAIINTCFISIYNSSDGLYDFIEAFAQIIREKIPSASEQEVYQMVSENIFGIKGVISTFLPDSSIRDLNISLSPAKISLILKKEKDTLKDVVFTKVKENLIQRPFVLVSHSQGNLFANRLYPMLEADDEAKKHLSQYANFQVASVANKVVARRKSYGDYLTSTKDLLVTAVEQLDSIEAPMPANIAADFRFINEDWGIGHNFLKIYTSNSLFGNYPIDNSERKFMSEHFLDKLIPLARSVLNEQPIISGDLSLSNVSVLSMDSIIGNLSVNIVGIPDRAEVIANFYSGSRYIGTSSATNVNGSVSLSYVNASLPHPESTDNIRAIVSINGQNSLELEATYNLVDTAPIFENTGIQGSYVLRLPQNGATYIHDFDGDGVQDATGEALYTVNQYVWGNAGTTLGAQGSTVYYSKWQGPGADYQIFKIGENEQCGESGTYYREVGRSYYNENEYAVFVSSCAQVSVYGKYENANFCSGAKVFTDLVANSWGLAIKYATIKNSTINFVTGDNVLIEYAEVVGNSQLSGNINLNTASISGATLKNVLIDYDTVVNGGSITDSTVQYLSTINNCTITDSLIVESTLNDEIIDGKTIINGIDQDTGEPYSEEDPPLVQ